MKISENNIREIQNALGQASQSIKAGGAGEKKYLLVSRNGNQVAVKPKSEIKDLHKLDFFRRIADFVKDRFASIILKHPPKHDLKLATFSEVSDLVEGLLNSNTIVRVQKLEILDQYKVMTEVYKKKERSLIEYLFFLMSNQSERADKILEKGNNDFHLLTREEVEAQNAAEFKKAQELKKKNDELNRDETPSWFQEDLSDQIAMTPPSKTLPSKLINNNIYEGVAEGEGGFKGQIIFFDFTNGLTTTDHGSFVDDKLEGKGKREEMANLHSSGRHFSFIYDGTFKDGWFVNGTISTPNSAHNKTSLMNYPFPNQSDLLELLGLKDGSYTQEELNKIKSIFNSGLQGYIRPQP